jgi:hypothetical protein
MYHQKGVSADGLPAIDVLHIFGRTNNTPHVYYYRRCIDKTRWTAWEKVDVDIEGNHLIPVIWNRRLYLFWAIFSEKQEEQSVTVPSAGETMPSGKKYWGIQLAWSEYKNKRWSAKKLSDAHESARDAKLTDKNLFYFRTEITHDNILIIHCKDENSGSLSVTTPANSNGLSIDVRLYANFTFIGCNSTPLITSGSTLPVSFKVPRGTGIEGMMLSSSSEPNLYLPASKADTPVLNSIDKESTRLLIPHQDNDFLHKDPFSFRITGEHF